MNTVRELADYFAHKVMLGFGAASPKLCRRGLDMKDEIDLVIPAEGDLDVAGDWQLQAYVEFPTWKGRGEVATLKVKNTI